MALGQIICTKVSEDVASIVREMAQERGVGVSEFLRDIITIALLPEHTDTLEAARIENRITTLRARADVIERQRNIELPLIIAEINELHRRLENLKCNMESVSA